MVRPGRNLPCRALEGRRAIRACTRLLSENGSVRALGGRADSTTSLEDHIRFEERELFEDVQLILNNADISVLADASRQ